MISAGETRRVRGLEGAIKSKEGELLMDDHGMCQNPARRVRFPARAAITYKCRVTKCPDYVKME